MPTRLNNLETLHSLRPTLGLLPNSDPEKQLGFPNGGLVIQTR
ncbi:hypothetical protein LF1_12000 [Rubripirellula obstinata]|uniref:Uncharacterized protein n=1 Tax=Rubripirellula obstinata TaxID=406547 RepID=A0A5B1CBY2_9BACT|nr:hypothetical protein LF1_12000 [Rubripirellula obstinata]